MAKLHELLAVESDLEGLYNRIVAETKKNFKDHQERYSGQRKVVEFYDEDVKPEADEYKHMDDTVLSKINYTSEHIIRYLDAVLQKERTNMDAKADIVVDGVAIAENVPATFLLGLEKRLKKIRNDVYASIPTLTPGVEWKIDESIGKDVYKMVHPEERFKTKKLRKNHIKYEATKEHPAQVDVYTEDERVARVLTYNWSGKLSSADKSALLEKIDKLIRAVKKARQKANTTEVVKETIGEKLFNYIHN